MDPASPGEAIPEPLRIQNAIADSDPNSPLETADLRRDADAQVCPHPLCSGSYSAFVVICTES